LEKCKQNGIRINPEKCVFCVNAGVIVGHIVCSDGLIMDPKNIIAIITMPIPFNVT
jgi:hypothetical protein